MLLTQQARINYSIIKHTQEQNKQQNKQNYER